MKMRVADFIADFLSENGIVDCFMVTGGGAMFLDDALGHHEKIHCTYNHHEQASAMAGEAYARVNNELAVVCVTTGPGATNAITGVAGAWMDSIPMIVLSGQVRYATSVYASGLKLRTRGVQEFDIIGSVSNMTKYCELVKDPLRIKYCLQKALYMAKEGRPGPCWLDIPLDVQSAMVEVDDMEEYEIPKNDYSIDTLTIEQIYKKIESAERPLIFAGNGIRLAGAHEDFLALVSKMKIPVVTGMSSVDAIETDNSYYVGRNGTTGDRAGNFAIQNCDVLLSLGSRQSFFQTGFNYENWAPQAYKIINDIDEEELKKDSLHADMKVCCDVRDLIVKLNAFLSEHELPQYAKWINQCGLWKEQYPVVQDKHYADDNANIYAFYHEMTKMLPADINIVASVGTSRVAGSQTAIIKKGQRFFTNPSMASMGYDLPAAIGVCVANNCKQTVLVTGDGSFQMNIQELQTIIQHEFPIAVFVMNNQGYHSIRMTQNSFFGKPLIGVGPESNDLSFPNLSKVIPAYGLDYYKIVNNSQITSVVAKMLDSNKPCLCEVMLSTTQVTEPKVASKRLADGRMISGTLEDMAPFLDEDELERNMSISKEQV